MGVGVIHQVSKLNRMVNMTHEPIPALNWPEMTMDLPVAKSVDLGSIKAGEQVKFHLELGPDNKYIITDIMK
ncbi:copper-binding protein [Desulfosediminicola ganghwensis]